MANIDAHFLQGPFLEYLDKGGIGRLHGFLACYFQASYVITGPDYVSVIAGEAINPRVTVKNAYKTMYLRFAIFFIGSALCIGIVLPANDPTPPVSLDRCCRHAVEIARFVRARFVRERGLWVGSLAGRRVGNFGKVMDVPAVCASLASFRTLLLIPQGERHTQSVVQRLARISLLLFPSHLTGVHARRQLHVLYMPTTDLTTQ